MIRLASRITRNNQLTHVLNSRKSIIYPELSIHTKLSSNVDCQTLLRGMTFAPKFMFSRRKKEQKFDSKLEDSLDKEYLKQKEKRGKAWEQRIYKFGMFNFIPFFGFIVLFLFGKAHLSKKQDRQAEEKNTSGKMSQRKNVTITPELGLRQLIARGDVMDLKLQVVRKNRTRGSNQYSTFCFLKRSNGQSVAAQIGSMYDFLTFVENLPQDYRVLFEYETLRQQDLESPMLKTLINVGLIVGALIIGRRIYQGIKTLAKQSGGQNPLDFDTKKIEAIKPQKINTFFKDVAGMHEAKFEITEFVDFLKEPQKYIEMGAKVPKGALLTGPPGTGKTLLARACAGQAGVPFYYVSGSDFVEKYVGLGASRVRKLFDEAQKNSPSIIFIDEIDAIGKKRDSGPFANEERDNTLNQLLVRMDGFDSQNKVIVMAATNIKDTLDPALLRPGRFDRAVEIGLPNFEERKQILQVHLKKVKFDPKFTIQELANRISILTPGFSGAQLANICNEAAILAARQGADVIDMPKFQKATQRVMAGLEKRNLFSDEEKLMLAYYQCGKAVVGWFTEGSDPIIKLSILPFSKASKGYSHTIKDQIGLVTKQEIIGKVCFFLAGRASQKYFQSYVTTNGDTDLKRAKRIVSSFVTKFGMSDRLKHIAFPDIEFVRKPYSSDIQIIIDQQIQKITKECIARVQKLIDEKKDLIQKLKVKLLEKDTLNHNELKEILGDRPFASNQNYQKYIVEEQKAHQQKADQEGELLNPIKQNSSQSSLNQSGENSNEDASKKEKDELHKFQSLKRQF